MITIIEYRKQFVFVIMVNEVFFIIIFSFTQTNTRIYINICIFNIVALIFVLSCFVLGLKLYLLSSCALPSASKLIMLNVTHIYGMYILH